MKPRKKQPRDYLSQLPEELIDEICSYLPEKRDLQRLRLCSKRLKETSSHAFDDRHLGVVKGKIHLKHCRALRRLDGSADGNCSHDHSEQS